MQNKKTNNFIFYLIYYKKYYKMILTVLESNITNNKKIKYIILIAIKYLLINRWRKIMKYNIIDIVDNKLTDTKLKEIVNKKLYKIIELMEFNVNYSK